MLRLRVLDKVAKEKEKVRLLVHWMATRRGAKGSSRRVQRGHSTEFKLRATAGWCVWLYVLQGCVVGACPRLCTWTADAVSGAAFASGGFAMKAEGAGGRGKGEGG